MVKVKNYTNYYANKNYLFGYQITSLVDSQDFLSAYCKLFFVNLINEIVKVGSGMMVTKSYCSILPPRMKEAPERP